MSIINNNPGSPVTPHPQPLEYGKIGMAPISASTTMMISSVVTLTASPPSAA
jgi:hypothetical protein